MKKFESPVIVWFRRDLRLSDNAALTAAAKSGAVLLPVYILDDKIPGDFRMGGASRWWLHHSLAALDDSLKKRGGALCLRTGDSSRVLASLLDETGAYAIHATKGYDPWDAKLEEAVANACQKTGATLELHSGRVLFDPEKIRTGSGAPYKVFTPFWKACLSAPEPHTPLRRPKHERFAKAKSETLDDLKLLPKKPDWAAGLRETWACGEEAAKKRLTDFIDDALADYPNARNNIDDVSTSRLSPYLHFGEISPNQVWHAVSHAAEGSRGKIHKGAESFLREIGWREFSYHLLDNFPAIISEPLRPEFADFPWHNDRAALRAWQSGETGYPIVDAAMRDLWHTGWMPNRARMVVASFLVKHLLIPWQEGEAWFWDTLVDADLANNSASWQWVTGCGADSAPYFRVFNPVLQGQKFDPDGDYVRTWVPELAKLSAADIHAPWQAPPLALQEASVTLGKTYPEPIVEHGAVRTRALKAFEKIKRDS
jgi:deoxyribodipyrimidine photo-lyase